MNQPLIGFLAAAFTGLQVGAAIFVTRLVVEDIGYLTLAFLRYGFAFVCILPFFLRLPRKPVSLRDIVQIMALGIVQFAAVVVLLNFGLQTVPAGQAAILFAVFPVFTVLIGWLMRQENINPTKIIGVVLSVIAVALVMSNRASTGGLGSATGSLAVLASSFCGGVSAVLFRPFLARYPTIQIGTISMGAAALCLAPLAWLENPLPNLVTLSMQSMAGAGFVGLSSAVGFLLWLVALKRIDASKAAVLLNLSPLVALFLGWFFLGEEVGPYLWVGVLLMFIGIRLVARTSRES